MIFVMFESNTAEASEYFSQYFSPWMTSAWCSTAWSPSSSGAACARSTCRASAPRRWRCC
ncbi:hypothetical protein P4133_13270 [Pseudomonas aeruginosa]|nr:hypothetical protein [Pseudomonas aeruginosa]